jgi:hypothetical protein
MSDRIWVIGTLFVGLSVCTAAAPAQQTQIVHSLGDTKPLPWTSLNIDRSARDFQFAIVADNAGTPRPGIWREAMYKLKRLPS